MSHKSQGNYHVDACIGECKWRDIKCNQCIGGNKREKANSQTTEEEM